MLIIGLTGSVASGKNFVASRIAELKIPVFDADLEVHKLMATNKEIFLAIQKSFPGAIVNNKIDRKLLGAEVLDDKHKLQNLEQIIYPLLHQQENLFIKKHRRQKQKIIVLNIPLLFEKGGYKRCDKTISVIVPKLTQLHRFKQRFKQNNKAENHIIEKKFRSIAKHQMNNLQRKTRADFVIHNGLSKAFCNAQIARIFSKLSLFIKN